MNTFSSPSRQLARQSSLVLLLSISLVYGSSQENEIAGPVKNQILNTDQPSKVQTLASETISLNLPVTLKALKDLGDLTVKKQIKTGVLEAAALQHVIELFLTQSPISKKKAAIDLLRPYGRLSAEMLSIWHLASFFKAYDENEILSAWKHGSTLLNSPLLPLLSPPDTEVFLHTLNTIAKQNSFDLPRDFQLDVSIWPLPPREVLVAASRWFYLLRKDDLSLIEASIGHFTNTSLLEPKLPVRIWQTTTDSSRIFNQNFTKPIPNILATLPDNSFYKYLIASFLFLAKSQSANPQYTIEGSAKQLRSRRQMVRRARRKGSIHDGDPKTKSIEFAKMALKTSLSNFHGYLACLQLAYLYQKKTDPESEARYIEKSLSFHVTTGSYLKLALFNRNRGSWRKMHHYNTMAREMDPHATLIEGPQPSLVQPGNSPHPKEYSTRNGPRSGSLNPPPRSD